MKQMAPCDRTEMTAKELVMLDSSNEKSLAVFAIITWKHLACWVFPTHAPQILPIQIQLLQINSSFATTSGCPANLESNIALLV